MARSAFATSIKLDGPFFKNQPGKTFRANVKVLMDAVAAEGQADVRTQLRQGNNSRAPISATGDHTSIHAVGRTTSVSGKRWQVTAVVSVNNVGLTKAAGVSLMAAAANVERQTGAFKRTAGRLRRARAVNVVELLKGIA